MVFIRAVMKLFAVFLLSNLFYWVLSYKKTVSHKTRRFQKQKILLMNSLFIIWMG